MKNKRISILILLTSLILVLTGCVNQISTISVNASGDSVLTIKIAVDKESYQQVELLGLKAPKNDELYSKDINKINPFFRKLANAYNAQDMEVTPIDDSFELGFIAHKNFSSVDSLNAFMRNLNKENLFSFAGEVVAKDLKVIQNYKAEGVIEYQFDDEIYEMAKKLAEKNNIDNKDIEKALQEGLEAKSEVEFIFPGNIMGATGHDESVDAGSPIFSNTIGEEPKTISVGARNVNKEGAAIGGVFAIVLVIVLLRAFVVKVIRKVRR